MMFYCKSGLSTAALAATLVACADPNPPADNHALASPTIEPRASTNNVFDAAGGVDPLPAEEVFLPDVFVENDGSITLGFRILAGYYIYRDKISVRSLTDGIGLGELELPPGEIVVDDWFGEQQVYYFDMMANAKVTRRNVAATSVEVEVSWQGCKADELCYMPVSKVIPVEFSAQVESAAE